MFSTLITPSSTDVNASGHVGFSVIAAWLEKGFESIYQIVNPQKDSTRGSVIVARLEVDYLAEVFDTEEVTLDTGLAAMGNSSFVLEQKMFQSGKPVAAARVTMVYFLYASQTAAPIPQEIRHTLGAHLVDVQGA